MRPRTVAYVLAVAACVLGASLAAALSPLPTLPGLPKSSPDGGDPYASGDNSTGNETNETEPPTNETKPPTNETKPPKNETRPPPNGTKNETLAPPSVSPEQQRLVGSAGNEVRFEVVVKNRASETQHVSVLLHAPSSWRTRVDPYNGSLHPGESVTVTGAISAPTLLPTHATVEVEARGRHASGFGYLDVCFVTPGLESCPAPPPTNGTKPPRNETKPPSNETKPPRNDTGGNETKPPTNETGGNETYEPPANETGESGMDAPAAAPSSRVAPAQRTVQAAPRLEARAGAATAPATVDGEGSLRLI